MGRAGCTRTVYLRAPHPNLLPPGEGTYLLSFRERIEVRASAAQDIGSVGESGAGRVGRTTPGWGGSDSSQTLKDLLIATRNPGKLAELTALLAGVPFTLVSLAQVGVEQEVDETGSTLEENAALKATTYARLSGLPTLADDSGLEVEALGGEPGPLSSRYAGEGATDAQRIAFLHEKLQNIPEKAWVARFRCVIAIAWPSGPVELHAGECHGTIIKGPRGSSGFGYDPVFLLPELGKTMAELAPEEKNRLSHRSAAARKAAEALKTRAAA